MASTLKFTGNVTGQIKARGSYVTKSYPTSAILYTTSTELPEKLDENALIFTTDTAELFVGTKTGIQKLKLGSEADLNPAIYLTIANAKNTYQTKEGMQKVKDDIYEDIYTLQNNVYTKEAINDFIAKDYDKDGVLDNLQTYTMQRIDELLGEKAASSDIYSKRETNELLLNKVNYDDFTPVQSAVNAMSPVLTRLSSDITTKANKDDVYRQTEIDNKFVAVNTSILDIQNNVTALDEAAAKQADVIDTIREINNRIDGLNDTKTSLAYVNEQDLAIKTTVGSLSRDLSDFKTTVYNKSEIDSKVRELNSAVQDTNTAINNSVAEINETIATLSHDITDNSAAIGNNVRDITNNARDIASAVIDINTIKSTLQTKANSTDVYTKIEVQNLLEGKTDLTALYRTIEEYNEQTIKEMFEREDALDLTLFYTKTEVDNLLANKASSTNLETLVERVSTIDRDVTRILETKLPAITNDMSTMAGQIDNALSTVNDNTIAVRSANRNSLEAKVNAQNAVDTANNALNIANSTIEKGDKAIVDSAAALSTATDAAAAVEGAVRAANNIQDLIAGVQLEFANLKNNTVNTATFTAELAKKADIVALENKASKTELTTGLSLKADKSALEDLADVVAIKSTVESALATKADTTTVDSKVREINNSITSIINSVEDLNTKLETAINDTSYVDTALQEKANITDVYTKAEVDEIINDTVRQVMNTLTLKLLGQ